MTWISPKGHEQAEGWIRPQTIKHPTTYHLLGQYHDGHVDVHDEEAAAGMILIPACNAGESYAGIYIPQLASSILEAYYNHSKPTINLKGEHEQTHALSCCSRHPDCDHALFHL